uniref:Uncharacterized protein n=1 Tax=Romanomermis culicivorax TaxID=13658 RepID=A0A915KIY7_ROMCU
MRTRTGFGVSIGLTIILALGISGPSTVMTVLAVGRRISGPVWLKRGVPVIGLKTSSAPGCKMPSRGCKTS